MNNEMKCLQCGRLLGKLVDGFGQGEVVVEIKCKQCRYMNVKRIKINKDVVQNAGNAV